MESADRRQEQAAPAGFRRPWQVRACPPDFAETFVREGWRGVEAKYGFHTRVNKRCIAESGGEALIARRQAFLAGRRRSRLTAPVPQPAPVAIAPAVAACIAFLRSRAGGAWQISATGLGDFYFESARVDGDEIVARAAARGFVPG